MTITAPARRVDTFDDLERAGDYVLVEHGQPDSVEGETRSLWFLLPIHEGETKFDRPTRGSGVHRIMEPPWTLRECADGSVEARASIAHYDAEGEYFHGYLDEGNVWRYEL